MDAKPHQMTPRQREELAEALSLLIGEVLYRLSSKGYVLRRVAPDDVHRPKS